MACDILWLVTFVNELLESMEAGAQTDVVIMDFTKAFDKVPHERLMTKLNYYGIGGSTHRWIRAFLSQRQQRVVLDGEAAQYVDHRGLC